MWIFCLRPENFKLGPTVPLIKKVSLNMNVWILQEQLPTVLNHLGDGSMNFPTRWSTVSQVQVIAHWFRDHGIEILDPQIFNLELIWDPSSKRRWLRVQHSTGNCRAFEEERSTLWLLAFWINITYLPMKAFYNHKNLALGLSVYFILNDAGVDS